MTWYQDTIPEMITVGAQAQIARLSPHLEEVSARLTFTLEGEDKTWCCLGLDRYYQSVGLWKEAERCCQQALNISREELGEHHLSTAFSLNNTAMLYCATGHYGKAEPLSKEALEITQNNLGRYHPATAKNMRNLKLQILKGIYKELD